MCVWCVRVYAFACGVSSFLKIKLVFRAFSRFELKSSVLLRTTTISICVRIWLTTTKTIPRYRINQFSLQSAKNYVKTVFRAICNLFTEIYGSLYARFLSEYKFYSVTYIAYMFVFMLDFSAIFSPYCEQRKAGYLPK